MKQFTALVSAATALALAACSDEPTRPGEHASSAAAPQASITPAAKLTFRQISAGYAYNCGVTANSVAYCWGYNYNGQLGIGNREGPENCSEYYPEPCSTRPLRVAGGLAFRTVSAGANHTCGITTSNAVYCWGANAYGELGNGTHGSTVSEPVLVLGGLSFRSVSAGTGALTCGVTTNNVAYCWGANYVGALGTGTNRGPEDCGHEFFCGTRPVRVSGGLTFRSVNAGAQYACGVTTSNVVYCWGYSGYGALGLGTTTGPETCVFAHGRRARCSTRPRRVLGGRLFQQVVAGTSHVCGVTTGSAAYCWGFNMQGQLGIGNATGPELCYDGPCSSRPLRVVGGLTFARLSVEGQNTCGVTTGGVTYCWGDNISGELGNGSNTGPEGCHESSPCSTRPVRVVGGLTFRSVSTGGAHSCGLTADNRGYCWGKNGDGQLGIGTNDQNPHPRPVAIGSP